jgi:hypothetical protein
MMAEMIGPATRDLIERLRAELRARSFDRMSEAETARLAAAHGESVHGCAMEGLDHDAADAALEAMLIEERVPTDVAVEIYQRFADELAGQGA